MHKAVLWIQGVFIPAVGAPGLLVVSFCDSSFLTIPEINDLLLVTFAAARPGHTPLFVLMTTLGSVAGCLVLREVGRRGGEPLLRRRFGRERVERTRDAFRRWDILALAVPAVLPPPLPFKIFVLSAGVFGFPLRRFVATLALARGLRYSFWGLMGAVYGQQGLDLLRRVDGWFAEHAVLVLILLAAGLLALAFVALRRRRADAGAGEAP